MGPSPCHCSLFWSQDGPQQQHTQQGAPGWDPIGSLPEGRGTVGYLLDFTSAICPRRSGLQGTLESVQSVSLFSKWGHRGSCFPVNMEPAAAELNPRPLGCLIKASIGLSEATPCPPSVNLESLIFQHVSKSPGGFVKTQIPRAPPQNFRFSRTEVGPRICISNSFPGDTGASGLGAIHVEKVLGAAVTQSMTGREESLTWLLGAFPSGCSHFPQVRPEWGGGGQLPALRRWAIPPSSHQRSKECSGAGCTLRLILAELGCR